MKYQLRLWWWGFVAVVSEWARDWRCWLWHDGTRVESPNRFDGNAYWDCNCGRRWCVPERAARTLKGGYRGSGRSPDVQWLCGGDWSPPMRPPKAPPPPKPKGDLLRTLDEVSTLLAKRPGEAD